MKNYPPGHKLFRVKDDPRNKLYWDCRGCGFIHAVNVDPTLPPPVWGWNGSYTAPTFTPSVNVTWTWGPEQIPKVCHFFVREGMIEFLPDCTHELAGKTVPMSDPNAHD